MHFLCVDDSEFVRSSLNTSLTSLGHEVSTADGAQKALELISTQTFDFIISDVNMPVTSGLDMLAQMRQQNLIPDATKIIMLTTETSANLKQRGKELGVHVWIIKPYKEASLIKVIEKLGAK